MKSRFALLAWAAVILTIGSAARIASAVMPPAPPPADLVLDYVSSLHGNINPCT